MQGTSSSSPREFDGVSSEARSAGTVGQSPRGSDGAVRGGAEVGQAGSVSSGALAAPVTIGMRFPRFDVAAAPHRL